LATIANPVKILTSVFSLFLSRPLGARSLLQRFFEVAAELSKTETELTQARAAVNNQPICDKVQAWIAANYDPNSTVKLDGIDNAKAFAFKILSSSSEPHIAPDILEKLNQQQWNNIQKLATVEMKFKDKTTFVEMLGDEHVISLAQEIIEVISIPLVELSSNANMPAILSALFKLLKTCTKIAEEDTPQDKKAEDYVQALTSFEEATFQSLQKVIMADKEDLLERVTMWGSQFFDSSKIIEFDLLALLAPLDEQSKLVIAAEVDAWINFKKKERTMKENFQRNPLHRPNQVVIPKLLCDPFIKAVQKSMEARML